VVFLILYLWRMRAASFVGARGGAQACQFVDQGGMAGAETGDAERVLGVEYGPVGEHHAQPARVR
jgi:hypothetical protein